MLAETSKAMQIANETVNMMSLSPVERQLYSSRMKLKSDIVTMTENCFTAGLAEGKTLGLAEGKTLGLAEGKTLGLAEGKTLGLAEGKTLGLAEGVRQKALETAKAMLQLRYPIEDVCKISGLSAAELAAL